MKKLVRFISPLASFSQFAGWEGTATKADDVEPGMWRVEWRHPPEGLPELVHERHLSFKIRKFSKRFA